MSATHFKGCPDSLLVLKDGTIAYGSSSGPICIINKQGEELSRIENKSQAVAVKLFELSEGRLMALNSIGYGLPEISFFSRQRKLKFSLKHISDVIQLRNGGLAASRQGAICLFNPNGKRVATFEKEGGFRESAKLLQLIDDRLAVYADFAIDILDLNQEQITCTSIWQPFEPCSPSYLTALTQLWDGRLAVRFAKRGLKLFSLEGETIASFSALGQQSIHKLIQLNDTTLLETNGLGVWFWDLISGESREFHLGIVWEESKTIPITYRRVCGQRVGLLSCKLIGSEARDRVHTVFRPRDAFQVQERVLMSDGANIWESSSGRWKMCCSADNLSQLADALCTLGDQVLVF